MSKQYSEPVIEIRKYILANDICATESDPDNDTDLNDGDDYEYFGG